MKQKLDDVQSTIRKYAIDGWLLYDFRRCNDLACNFLDIPQNQLLTRRFFYWIPAKGEPIKIVHAIEDPLKNLPGKTLKFSSWQQMEKHLADVLKGSRRIAMEYSPRNAIPYVSKVDAGTIEVIRGLGVDVVSSCDLLQKFTGILTPHEVETHLKAAQVLDQTVENTWKMISQALCTKKKINEYDVQQFILKEFDEHQCVTADPPICAINAHTADPHYCPQESSAAEIKSDDFILIDLWCKLKEPDAVYADITRVAVAAKNPSSRQQEIFTIVKKAQQAATDLVKERFATNQPLRGWEVDQVARDVIHTAGYGEYFIHRTGHSIDTSDHGSGTHIDNLETQDQRLIIPGTCFSIEPGIYLPGEFGIRLEYDLYVDLDGSVKITGGVQDSIVTLI